MDLQHRMTLGTMNGTIISQKIISLKNPKTQLLLVDEKPNSPEKEDEFVAYKKPTIPDTENGFQSLQKF